MTSGSSKNTDLLIIIPPLGAKNTAYPPYGSMYIASALREKGYVPHILNVDVERIRNAEVIKRIKDINPRYIGFSGIIATSYKYIKNLSHELKRAFPGKTQILGGGLSSAAEPVLKNTSIDVVVCGEGDITIVELMDCLKEKGDLSRIRGICYKKCNSCMYTDKRPLILRLDTLPYPAFDLIDMTKYLPDGVDFIKNCSTKIDDEKIFDIKRKRKTITIPTSRGCFNECSFCFRAYSGLRVNSIKYVFDFIEYCIEKFDVGYCTLGDECFAPNIKRNLEFIEEYKRRKLDIIFRILGMRVDTVDPEILRGYKEIGCWMIEYGFESGSQKMLNIINKQVSVEQNRNAALWTHDAGIYTSPAFVLGMPGETNETIDETIGFLKSLNFDFKQYQWKYAIPIPGSELYRFAKIAGVIKDEDKYLLSLTGDAGSGDFNINLTDQPDEIVAGWSDRLRASLDTDYLDKSKVNNRFIAKLTNLLLLLELNYRRKTLFLRLGKKVQNLLRSIFNKNKKASFKEKESSLQKRINIENIIKDLNYKSVNREMSLKKISDGLIKDQK